MTTFVNYLEKAKSQMKWDMPLESEILKLKTYFINATQPVEETTEPVEKKSRG